MAPECSASRPALPPALQVLMSQARDVRGITVSRSVLTADATTRRRAHTLAMAPSQGTPARYAASFVSGYSAAADGALVVEETRLVLEGRSPQGHIERCIPYSEISDVRVGRLPEERLNGHPALLLSLRDGATLRVKPMGSGLLSELADLISTLAHEQADEHEEVAVVLPLRKGRLSRARELVAEGPPFDPAVLSLTRHEVYLTEEEAVFVFEGPNVRTMLGRLTRDPTLWQAGLAWRDCVGGRPRLSTELPRSGEPPVFSWKAGAPAD